MRVNKYIFNKVILILLIFIFTRDSAFGMQTIFNVPSSDVTEKGHVFLQQEAQFRAWNPDAFYVGTTYSAIGIGHHTELDATLFNVGAPTTQNITLGIGFKSALPVPMLNEKFHKREIKLTVGSAVLVGLEGNGTGNWTYTHLSGRIPKLNTRVTTGISYGTKQVFGENTTSFIAGVEQPITKKLTLLGDWYSGNEHWAGYLIVGGSYSLPKNVTIFSGYQIPYSSQVGPSGLVFEIAKIY